MRVLEPDNSCRCRHRHESVDGERAVGENTVAQRRWVGNLTRDRHETSFGCSSSYFLVEPARQAADHYRRSMGWVGPLATATSFVVFLVLAFVIVMRPFADQWGNWALVFVLTAAFGGSYGVAKALPDGVFPAEPPELPWDMAVNKACADRGDELSDGDAAIRYKLCGGYVACTRQARLDGDPDTCEAWEEWPDEDLSAVISKRYFEEYPEEEKELMKELQKGSGYVPDYSEPYVPECTSRIDC